MAIFGRFLKDFLIGGVHLYQWLLSPLLGKCCRFYPSCSQYAKDAFEKHGVGKGGFLTIKRLCKCHPFHQGGIDHVP